MKAVQFDDYGGIDVLEVRDVARPEPGLTRCSWQSAPPASTSAKRRSVQARSVRSSPVVPIQRTYPLDDVRAAFTELEAGHIAGKIVLIP